MTHLSRRALIASGTVFAAAPAFAQTRDPARLRVALLPDENASTIIQNAQPLKAHLERSLRKEIELVVTTDYSSMIEAARFGRIEIAYFGPFSYVLAKSRAPGIEPFAVGVERGAPFYNSVVIAQKDGPVKALADVRGKPFAFGDQASTSSHLVPRAMLLQRAGLDGARDYRPVHVGTHDAVARTVQSGQAPAGALSKPILDTLYQRNAVERERIVEIELSDPIPNYPMVMQGNLVQGLKDAIRAAFLDVKDEQVLRSFRVQGFAPTDDKAYDVLRETARVLQLDITQMRG
jgi:phosphonate transport system substrate-binding protein